MTKQRGSLFNDLAGMRIEEVETMFESTLVELSDLEAILVQQHVKKKIHSETIKFAVNKTTMPPSMGDDYTDAAIVSALEQKSEFDACLRVRDELVERLAVPRHRVAHTLVDFHQKLTASTHEEAPTLASEMEMFSKFFEFQSMLKIYKEQHDVLHNLNRARKRLLETVKEVNKNDRRLAQTIAQTRERSRHLRSEAGRLRAYLEKNSSGSKHPIPPPSADASERLRAGEALSMEEFASMLEHGGLTDMGAAEPSKAPASKQSKSSMRRADARRGERRVETNKKE